MDLVDLSYDRFARRLIAANPHDRPTLCETIPGDLFPEPPGGWGSVSTVFWTD